MSRIETVTEQIRTARNYTQSILDNIDPKDWFRHPSEGVTHIAWQVGHLAAAEYSLTLRRILGLRPSDEELIPEAFRKAFGKGSVPEAGSRAYPEPEEIRRVFERVHAQALEELGRLSDAVLDEPVENPHPMFSTKGGALLFCSQHEMLHAGQIGLLRRLFGASPLR